MRGRIRLMLDLFPGLHDKDRRIGHLMLTNTNGIVYGVSGELVTWVGVRSLAEALLYSDGEVPFSAGDAAKRARSAERVVKRARARLVEAGILVLVEQGGRGRSSTSRFRFSVERLVDFERDATRTGVLQRFGAEDEAVTLSMGSDQGDTSATLGGGDASDVQGDMTVQGDRGVTLSLDDGRQGGAAITLGGSGGVVAAQQSCVGAHHNGSLVAISLYQGIELAA